MNPSCAFDADLESILLGDPPQNPFSTASVRSGRDAFVKQCPLLSQNRTSVRFDNLAKYDCKIKVRFEGAVADAVAFARSRELHRIDGRQSVRDACPALAPILADPKATRSGAESKPIAVQVQREPMAVDDIIGM